MADDFHTLAFVNQLSLRDYVDNFIAELGLASRSQGRDGDTHLPEPRDLLPLELRFGDDATGVLRNQFAVE